MNAFIKLSLVFVLAAIPRSGLTFPEFPFCPAGGPPGWMNYFNYKRDQNLWRQYSTLPPPYHEPYYFEPYSNNASNSNALPYQPAPYTPQPYRRDGWY